MLGLRYVLYNNDSFETVVKSLIARQKQFHIIVKHTLHLLILLTAGSKGLFETRPVRIRIVRGRRRYPIFVKFCTEDAKTQQRNGMGFNRKLPYGMDTLRWYHKTSSNTEPRFKTLFIHYTLWP